MLINVEEHKKSDFSLVMCSHPLYLCLFQVILKILIQYDLQQFNNQFFCLFSCFLWVFFWFPEGGSQGLEIFGLFSIAPTFFITCLLMNAIF